MEKDMGNEQQIANMKLDKAEEILLSLQHIKGNLAWGKKKLREVIDGTASRAFDKVWVAKVVAAQTTELAKLLKQILLEHPSLMGNYELAQIYVAIDSCSWSKNEDFYKAMQAYGGVFFLFCTKVTTAIDQLNKLAYQIEFDFNEQAGVA